MHTYLPIGAAGMLAVARAATPVASLNARSDGSVSTAPATRVIAAAAPMLSVQRGTATVGIEVQAGDRQLAHGLATSLLLPRA